MKFNAASFRDPCGKIFETDGRVIRAVFSPGQKNYHAARQAGIHEKLIESGLLIDHRETEDFSEAFEAGTLCLEHPRLKMVSYPWEWPYTMLKDAACLHLDIMSKLIPEGFWLRDASAFNVQYDGKKLRLIDTLSIGPRPKDSPWVAYKQFCEHFLAPLALAAHGDVRTLSMWKCFIDGFPLDMVVNLLSSYKFLRPGLLMHLKLHAKFQHDADKKEDLSREKKEVPKLSDLQLTGLIKSLKSTVRKLNWQRVSAIWETYGDLRTYEEIDVTAKRKFVEQVVCRLNPELVWDLGGNTGEFSLIAAKHGAFVVCIDADAACVEQLYLKIRREHIENVLPLTMDLANPSPSLGWNCVERMGLKERGPADLLLALALVHHLVFKCCVPLPLVGEWLGQLGRHVVVEFVPENDPMVTRLLMNRTDGHHPYSRKHFEAAFEPHFTVRHTMMLKNGRSLYHLEKK